MINCPIGESGMDNFKFDKVRFWIIFILAIIGIAMCVDLGYIFYKTNFLTQYAPSFCAVSDLIDCDGVAKTTYAVSAGVPNALWGLILYLIILMLLFVDRIQAKFKNTIFDVFENPRSYIAFLGLLSFAISMILASISIFKINKICVLCFATYFVNLFIAFSAKTEGFFLNDIKITIQDFIKGAKKYFVLFLIVLISFVSTLIYLDRSLIFSPRLKKERAFNEFYRAKKNKYAVKGNILGKKDAKVIINVYSDYNCPFCRVVNIMLHKAAKQRGILVNEISFPIDASCNKRIGVTLGGHESSCTYSKYALAAKKQGYFWGMSNILFDTHPQNFNALTNEIKKMGLKIDIEKLKADANSDEIAQELQKEINLTISKSIMATPVIEINGVVYVGAMPYEKLLKEIDLAKKRIQN